MQYHKKATVMCLAEQWIHIGRIYLCYNPAEMWNEFTPKFHFVEGRIKLEEFIEHHLKFYQIWYWTNFKKLHKENRTICRLYLNFTVQNLQL